jgi:hypothetical protein
VVVILLCLASGLSDPVRVPFLCSGRSTGTTCLQAQVCAIPSLLPCMAWACSVGWCLSSSCSFPDNFRSVVALADFSTLFLPRSLLIIRRVLDELVFLQHLVGYWTAVGQCSGGQGPRDDAVSLGENACPSRLSVCWPAGLGTLLSLGSSKLPYRIVTLPNKVVNRSSVLESYLSLFWIRSQHPTRPAWLLLNLP